MTGPMRASRSASRSAPSRYARIFDQPPAAPGAARADPAAGPACAPPQQPSPVTARPSFLSSKAKTSSAFTTAPGPAASPDRPTGTSAPTNSNSTTTQRGRRANNGGTLVFKGLPSFTCRGRFPLADQFRSPTSRPPSACSPQSRQRSSAHGAISIWRPTTTITFRYMGLRGLQIATMRATSRRAYSGMSLSRISPNDQVEKRSRYAGQIRHNETFGNGWAGNPRTFRGFRSALLHRPQLAAVLTSQVNLPVRGTGYSGGGGGTPRACSRSFQTLQDPNTGVSSPSPTTSACPSSPHGPAARSFPGNDLPAASEFVDFSHPTSPKGAGSRFIRSSRCRCRPRLYVTPLIGVHATRYDVNTGGPDTGDEPSPGKLPIFSVDSGVTFERDTDFGGTGLHPDPRAAGLLPLRALPDQSKFPNFDSGLLRLQLRADLRRERLHRRRPHLQRQPGHHRPAEPPDRPQRPAPEVIRAAIGQRRIGGSAGLPEQRRAGAHRQTGRPARRLQCHLRPRTQFDTAGSTTRGTTGPRRFNFGVRFQPAYARSLGVSWRYRRNYSTVPNAPTVSATSTSPASGRWGNWYGVGRYNRNLRTTA